MEKKDLEFGMIVETREGNKCLLHTRDNYHGSTYCVDYEETDVYLRNIENGIWIGTLDLYTDTLFDKDFDNEFDIIKVYKDYTLKEVLWERKEVPQLSDDAISLLKLLQKNWKYIALDKDFMEDEIWVYNYQPCKERGKNGIVYFKPEPILEHKWSSLSAFSNFFECLQKGECYLIEDLIKGEYKDEK